MVRFFQRVNGHIKYKLRKYLGFENHFSIYTNLYLKDKSNCEIGEYTYGHPTIREWGEGKILKIGKFCSIAHNVEIFLGGNHRIDWISTYPFNMFPENFPEAKKIKGHPHSKGDVNIGNDVWIGQNSVILSGVKIGHGAVIGTNSLITKNIGDYEIWGGNPARFIKKRFDDDKIAFLLELEWWNWDISKIIENVELICSQNFLELKNKNNVFR